MPGDRADRIAVFLSRELVKRVPRLTRVLVEAGALTDSTAMLEESRRAHYDRYPGLHRLRLYWLWTGLHLGIAVYGVLGADHPDTLQSRGNLAVAYQGSGRTGEAITLHEQTLAARERVLGADHPDTLQSRGNLAIAYRAARRTSEADDQDL